jgi:NAD-dependent deacetylase
VYPAAGLIEYAPYESEKYYIDPKAEMMRSDFAIIKEKAGRGVTELVNRLMS